MQVILTDGGECCREATNVNNNNKKFTLAAKGKLARVSHYKVKENGDVSGSQKATTKERPTRRLIEPVNSVTRPLDPSARGSGGTRGKKKLAKQLATGKNEPRDGGAKQNVSLSLVCL